MELDAYLRAIFRMWYVPLALLALAISGSWLYLNVTSEAEATATVAVLEPRAPVPGEFIAPRLGFDVIDESEELASRVASRLDDGTTAGELNGSISIKLKPTLDRSPLYLVSASHEIEARAIEIANIAVEEATILYVEFNKPSLKDVRAAFQPELDRAEVDEAEARAALSRYVTENDAYSLPLRTDQQILLISQLRSSIYTAAGPDASGTESAALASARSELQRLTSLGGEFDSLSFEADLASDAVIRLEVQVSQLTVSGGEDALSAAEAELESARFRQSEAQAAFDAFKDEHGVSDLAGAIQPQLLRVNDLAIADASSLEGVDARQSALTIEEAELQRLMSLEPEYTKLELERTQAEDLRFTIEQQILGVVVAQTLPSESQVKLLESAVAVSGLWWAMITYTLAVMLAMFLSLTLIYLLAFFERTFPTAEELERQLGAPLLVRVPEATEQGGRHG